MHNTIGSYVKPYRSCQINKRHSQKYGHVPPKLIIMASWRALCVVLIGPYTLKGKDGSSIDFMCLTMIDTVASWFEIVELPTITKLTGPATGKGKKVSWKDYYTKELEMTFDRSSAQISNLVYKTWFSRYPLCQYLIYDNGSKIKLHFHGLWDTYGIKHKPTSVKNPQANAILELFMLSLQTCYAQLKLIWLIRGNPATSTSFYQMPHGSFALPTIQYSKPHQVQQYFDETYPLTFHS